MAARHWAAQVTKMTLMQYAVIPLIFTPTSYPVYVGAAPHFYESVSDPVYGEAAHASNWGVQVNFLKFTRDDEIEADRIGLLLLYKVGYDPNAYTSFLRKLLEDERRDSRPPLPKIFIDHPSTSERILRAGKEIKRFPVRAQYVDNASEFNAVKVRLDDMLTSEKKKDKRKDMEDLAPRLIRKQGS
jgi:predicted Zn-dependent protease